VKPPSFLLLLAAVSTAAAAPLPVRNVRIVDFGSDLGSGELMYRGKSPERKIDYDPSMKGDARHAKGTTFVSAWPLLMDEPLNAPGIRYDASQKNAVLYGGLVTLTINNPERGLSEGHLNANHEFRDDFNFMALQGGAFKPGEEIEAYAFWFWKKKDFLNGGDAASVSFNAGSRIAVHISRYWGGVHAGRWVVRDGDAFYVSEKTFGDTYKQFTFEDKENPITRHTQILFPAQSRWARWEPKEPCTLAFDHRKADFQEHEFRDVTAVGFLVTRELSPAVKAVPGGLSPNQPIAVKWYAFRCDAVVGDGNPPSPVLPAVDVAGLSAARSEVTFSQWETVRRLVVTNQYCRDLGDLGYAFSGDGSMGSMRVGDMAHQPGEPVTDITWLDAAAWCNALSEVEGRTPAYYTDAGHQNVFRRVFNRDQAGSLPPTIHWKQDADGYRLPTLSEWAAFALAGGKNFSENPAASGKSTLPVAAISPGPQGLVGLNGNVWEYVWPGDNPTVDPSTLSSLNVLGGDFASSTGPRKTNIGFGPESPFEAGSFNIGFRPVRGPVLSGATSSTGIPVWKIARGEVIPPGPAGDAASLKAFSQEHLPLASLPDAGFAGPRDFVDPLSVQERNTSRAKALDDKFLGKSDGATPAPEHPIERKAYTLHLGKTEVPYNVWNRVKAWALGHGYHFNYPGDVGSMRLPGRPDASFSPNEPVTFISWYDAVAWCNALSELCGLKPAYHTDASKSQPFRQVSPFRLETYSGPGYPNPVWKKNLPPGAKPDTALNTLIFFDADSGGYRLPLWDEFQAADVTAPEEWTGGNAGGKTHDVASLPAGPTGLNDMGGNVLEWGWDSNAPHINSMVDYRINGNAYFFEPPESAKPGKAFYKEYTGAARPFIGFRVAKGGGE